MIQSEIEKGDTILLKDGRSVRVLSTYSPAGKLVHVNVVDDANPSPMRESVFEKDIAKILCKGKKFNTMEDKLPPEQAVKSKEPISEAIKKDVASREKHTTSAAASRHKAEAEVVGKK
jgi:hypothetical protein